jgi:hypothetical protein
MASDEDGDTRQAGFLIALGGRSPLLYTVEHLGSLGCSFLANLDYHLFSMSLSVPAFFLLSLW